MIAHNEERYISKAVESVFEYVGPEKLVLVADSCTDRTASIARDLDAEVHEEEPIRSPAEEVHAVSMSCPCPDVAACPWSIRHLKGPLPAIWTGPDVV